MSAITKSYAKEVNLEVVKNDDPLVTYTDNDASADLTLETQKFIVAETDEEIYTNPAATLTDADMTVTATTSKLRVPDSVDIGYWRYRWTFTDTSGNDITTHYGTLKII